MLRGHVFKFQTFANEVFAHFINTFLNGNMGITKGCELSHTNSSVSIGAGYFCVYGRYLEIVGNETIDNITNTGYYRLVCEIDLSKINTSSELNQAEIKVLRGTSDYPTLVKENLENGGDVYQYEFANFRVTDNGITSFSDVRTFLNFNSIYSQIGSAFQSLFNTKSNEADSLLDSIQNELDGIEDRSGLLPTSGGTINGDLTINGTVSANSIANIKKIEQTAISMSSTTKTVSLNYPTGFSATNCVVIACGILNNNYSIPAYTFGDSDVYGNTLKASVNLTSNAIEVKITKGNSTEEYLDLKLVLMKI